MSRLVSSVSIVVVVVDVAAWLSVLFYLLRHRVSYSGGGGWKKGRCVGAGVGADGCSSVFVRDDRCYDERPHPVDV